MRNIILFFLGLALIVSSCDEITPPIELAKTNRVVVIEEFTGVRCVNCPAGSAKIEELLAAYDESLIAVSIHAGGFSVPYNESKYDFSTADGDALNNYLGPPPGYPSAVINRKVFNGERVVFLNDWAGLISQELSEAPKARVDVVRTYNPDTRVLGLNLDFFFLERVEGKVNYSVMITENNIKDYQETPDGKVSDYKHKHVMREVLSNEFNGDNLGTDIATNTSFSNNLTFEIPTEWVAENCHVIIFINRDDSGTLDILQANELSLME